MNFELNEHAWIKSLQVKGAVKEKNEDGTQYKITYHDKNNNDKREIAWFNIEDLDKVKERTQNNRPYKQDKPLKIKVLYHTDNPELEQTTIGNWIDLRSAIDIELKQFEFKIIPLGISIQLPKGFEAELKPRSGTFKNFGIIQTNSVGCIDETYAGNGDIWGMPVLAMRDTKINRGDRICQFRINRVMPKLDIEKVETLDNEDRGGFGSSGVK